MQMQVEEISGGITKINLDGDLDAKGSAEIDVSFAAVTAAREKVVVDLSKVGFLASIGIRTLLSAAKIMGRRSGRLVLTGANADVAKVLSISGVEQVLAIHPGLDEALAALA